MFLKENAFIFQKIKARSFHKFRPNFVIWILMIIFVECSRGLFFTSCSRQPSVQYEAVNFFKHEKIKQRGKEMWCGRTRGASVYTKTRATGVALAQILIARVTQQAACQDTTCQAVLQGSKQSEGPSTI